MNITKQKSIWLAAILFLICIFSCSCADIYGEKEVEVNLTNQTEKIVVKKNTDKLTLNGSSTTAIISMVIKEGENPLLLYLNNVNAVGIEGSSLISCETGREIHIIVSGQNTLNGVRNVAINCVSSSIYFEGNGVLTIIGGSGLNGSNGKQEGTGGQIGVNGYEGLIASNIIVNMTNTLTVSGGNGGNGGNGANGVNGTNGNDKGWGQSVVTGTGATEHGGDGGKGGNGARGGNGADSVRISSLTVNSGKVLLMGGNGGSAGNGGNGGKGGRGGKNDWWIGYQGGHPGNGGNGGDGGNGSYGGNRTLIEDLLILPDEASVEILQGNNGRAGRGGYGGAYGDASGDADGDMYYVATYGDSGRSGISA